MSRAFQSPSAHDSYMQRCIELAGTALESGDTPVGALLVRDGRVRGEGVEGVKRLQDVTAHAEMLAVRQACERLHTRDLSGATLYTTVEPCIMCAYAIRLARVGRVVTGAPSPDAGGPMDGISVLRHPGVLPDRPVVELVRGVLETECLQVLARGAARQAPRR